MARTGENIYKRKDGRWEGRYIKLYDASGKPKYGYVYSRTYSEAKQKLAEKRCHSPAADGSSNRTTAKYDDILTEWLQSSRTNIKESTFAKYSHIIDSHIRPALGQFPLGKISTQLIESFIQQQLLAGRLDGKGGLSPKTVTDMLAIIKESIGYAQDNGITVICNPQRITVKKKEREMRVLTLLEEEALVRVLLDDIDQYKFGVMLSLYTGIRIGELCALQWDSLSAGEKLIKLVEDGSGFGIHFVVTSLEYQTVRECMYYGENLLSKFPERIIYSLGANDADNLIENVSVSGLRENTVYFTDGVKNTFQMKPYVTPGISELSNFLEEIKGDNR